MNIRGVLRRDASTVTTVFLGEFKEFKMQEMFMDLVSRSNR
jgi:GTP cyclohydrolase I